MVTRETLFLSDLFRRAGVTALDGGDAAGIPLRGLSDDSRRVEKGSCFVAVRGESTDGHRFVQDAVARGATSVVAERKITTPAGVAAIRVADSRLALAKLSSCYYGLRGEDGDAFPLVGVTGTNGKTTVAWLLRAILRAASYPTTLLGTIEYDLVGRTVKSPLTTPGALELAKLLAEAREAGARFGVLEVSSHALAQRRCDGLSLAAGVFTNLSGDHIDYHGSMAAYFEAKRRLFDLLAVDGVAIVNADDAHGRRLAGELSSRVIAFSLEGRADVCGVIDSMDGTGTTLLISAEGVESRVRTSLVGRHNAANVLAALATARALGIETAAILRGLESVSDVPGRLERVAGGDGSFSVFVDYAHTDDALRSALGAVRPLTRGRVICVFGCGGDRDRTKRPRMAAAVAGGADVAVVTSDNPRSEAAMQIIEDILPGLRGGCGCEVAVEPQRRKAIARAIELAGSGDTILIAGKGHEDYQIVGDQVFPFDDASVVREVLAGVPKMEEVA